MTTLIFNAIVFKNDSGFVARAEELGISSTPVSTRRGALKRLKDAVRLRLASASRNGTLKELLQKAGYKGTFAHSSGDVKMEVMVWDRQPVSIRLPRAA